MSLFGKNDNSLLAQSYNQKYGMNTLKTPSNTELPANPSNNCIEFNPTRKVNDYLLIDDIEKSFAITKPKVFGSPIVLRSIPYNQLLSFELLEDENSITSGGLGMAAIGALTFGATGAIVGSVVGGKKSKRLVNSLRIKITLTDITLPPLYIHLISMQTRSDSLLYKTAYNDAQSILSVLSQMVNQMEQTEEHSNESVKPLPTSVADEIRKFKELMDEGIITEEEFNAKKKQLLDL